MQWVLCFIEQIALFISLKTKTKVINWTKEFDFVEIIKEEGEMIFANTDSILFFNNKEFEKKETFCNETCNALRLALDDIVRIVL